MTTEQDLLIWFGGFRRTNDLEGIARLLDDHPEMVTSPQCASTMIHSAARDGNTALVALLVGRGVDVNMPDDPQTPDRPIGTASRCNRLDTVRWLLEHGSDVNYGWDGDFDTCVPLSAAIYLGNFEMVRLLVEAGAYLNVLDRTNRTPLGWAGGQPEIAAYLRSKGALEPHEVPGYVPRPLPDPIPEHIDRAVGPVRPNSWLPIVPDDANPVPVRAADGDGVVCLFTAGMSARPQPPGPGDGYDRAELACFLAGWPDDPADWTDAHLWPVHWLRRLAAYPWQTGVGYGGPVAVVANGDPPAPLGPGTALTCWLLLADKAPLERAYLADGTEVVFYTAVPIHTAERNYERAHGTEALLERFADAGVPDHIDPARPSVV
ncbi:suppressor of fused domain protein [Urbifossiella limnaea]|uniref:Ankyrin repeats (3 copies) n=1 Tax=Urbifossiella limnaea TaxID=2528023 RepID=A0A517Y1Z3_9BACT|nr:suppressor of fused domain protein [Urbifossiella limnaea]QDU23781.1 Ankyrin repeats (3 copies) [Urbifossiella limnaea]